MDKVINRGWSQDEMFRVKTRASSWLLPAFQPAAWELTEGIKFGQLLVLWSPY